MSASRILLHSFSWAAAGVLCAVIAAIPTAALTQTSNAGQSITLATPVTSGTRLVLLGTGTPAIDPDRSGPASAVVVNGTAYLVDMGAGIVRRAKSAVVDKGVTALEPVKLRYVFVTHLHSDHTVGFPDLWLTPWVMGRPFPLEVYGPGGLRSMSSHLMSAYREDFATRSRDRKLFTVGAFAEGHGINAHEIHAGIVYKDANVTVTAFRTKHAIDSYGYRFDTADRSIVFSGDTNPTQATIDACNGCDILVHEVLTQDWLSRRPDFVAYAARYHTTTTQLVELAKKARPRLLVLYHASLSLRPSVDPQRSPPATFLHEMSAYPGHVVVGRDLDVY